MADPFIGEIRAFGFNFAPYQWAFCDGALVPIQQNTSLFSILGTNYGGNGTTTFGLPNLMGQAVIGVGNNQVGEQQGATGVSLTLSEMPVHTHDLNVNANQFISPGPGGHLPSKLASGNLYAATTDTPAPTLTTLSPLAINVVGQGVAHENCQPFGVLNFCISLYGVFPIRP
jgi:microcystin-dependent protein